MVRYLLKAIGIAFGLIAICLNYLAFSGLTSAVTKGDIVHGILMWVMFLFFSIVPLVLAYMLVWKLSARGIRVLCALIAIVGWLFINSQILKIFDPRQYRTEYPMFLAYVFMGLATTIAAALFMRWLYKTSVGFVIKWAAIDETAEQGATRDRRKTTHASS